MFVAKNQFYVLLACVAFGGVAGLLLSAINFFGYLTKQKILKFVCGVIALSIIGVLYSYYSYKLFFPTPIKAILGCTNSKNACIDDVLEP